MPRPTRRLAHSSFAADVLEARTMLSAVAADVRLSDVTTESAADASRHVSMRSSFARIVNGTQTDDFPAVGFVGPGGCTGTLISPTHVLTAAHCFGDPGRYNATFVLDGETYRSEAVTIHPDYVDANFDRGDDLAIITLDRPVTGVTPVPLYRQTPRVGMTLTLVGFGEGGTSTDGFDPDDTGKQVGQTRLDGVTAEHITWDFDSHDEANTAPGDSGGPAFVTVNGRRSIIGVTSGGTGKAQSLGDESFDTRIDIHAAWIDGVVDGTNPGPPSPADDHTNRPGREATVIALSGSGAGGAGGTFEEVGDRDAFTFTVPADGETTVSMAGDGSTVDTYLRLYDRRGRLIAENDDIGERVDSRLTLRLDAGKYYVVSGTYEDQSTGDYRVRIRHSADEVAPGEQYATYQNNRDRTISEDGTGSVSTAIRTRVLSGRVSDVNVTVGVDHTYVGDLRMTLVSPSGKRIVLVSYKGEDGENFDRTTFDSASRTHINNASAPYRGTFRPAQTLDRLNGADPNGLWRLIVNDNADADGGRLDFWRLDIATEAGPRAVTSAPRTPSFITPTPAPLPTPLEANLTSPATRRGEPQAVPRPAADSSGALPPVAASPATSVHVALLDDLLAHEPEWMSRGPRRSSIRRG